MNEKFKSCCFTGYRPSKFPFPLDKKDKEYIKMENKLIDAVFSLTSENCYTFYTGGAMGFDIIAAEIVLLLKASPKLDASVELICAVPFIEQGKTYDSEWKSRYENILAEADEIVLISDNYYPGCYRKRNEFMVDNSDFVITWYDGRSGGTHNTVRYAKSKNKRIVNLSEYGVHEYIDTDDYDIIDEY